MKLKCAHLHYWGKSVIVGGTEYQVGEDGIVDGLTEEHHDELLEGAGWRRLDAAPAGSPWVEDSGSGSGSDSAPPLRPAMTPEALALPESELSEEGESEVEAVSSDASSDADAPSPGLLGRAADSLFHPKKRRRGSIAPKE